MFAKLHRNALKVVGIFFLVTALATLFRQPTVSLIALLGAAVAFECDRCRRTRREFECAHLNLVAAQRLANLGSWESDLAGGLWWSPETYHILGVDPAT